MKSLSIQETEYIKINNPNNDEIVFKDFINFITNKIVLSVKVTEKKNLLIEYTLSNIFIFDLDSEYTKEGQMIDDVTKKLLLNREFCVEFF